MLISLSITLHLFRITFNYLVMFCMNRESDKALAYDLNVHPPLSAYHWTDLMPVAVIYFALFKLKKIL